MVWGHPVFQKLPGDFTIFKFIFTERLTESANPPSTFILTPSLH